MKEPVVGLLMGSKNDWPVMRHAAERLDSFAIPYEKKIVSAHRTPTLRPRKQCSESERGESNRGTILHTE